MKPGPENLLLSLLENRKGVYFLVNEGEMCLFWGDLWDLHAFLLVLVFVFVGFSCIYVVIAIFACCCCLLLLFVVFLLFWMRPRLFSSSDPLNLPISTPVCLLMFMLFAFVCVLFDFV